MNQSSLLRFFCIFYCHLLFFLSHSHAQTTADVDWSWAHAAGDPADEYAYDVISDSEGNIYVTGAFKGTLNWGTYSINSVGDYDLFLAKLDSSGNIIWLETAGGNNNDLAYAITQHPNGNLYIAGSVGNNFQIGGQTMSINNVRDAFYAEFDTAGNFIQIQIQSGGSQERYRTIEIDQWGNIYVGGNLGIGSTGATLDTLVINQPQGVYYQFPMVAKFNAQGDIQWASYAVIDTNAGSSASSSWVEALAIDDNGDVYATGQFRGKMTYGSDSLLGGVTFDAFILKMDNNGQTLWLRGGGGPGHDRGTDVAINPLGQPQMYGYFDELAIIDGLQFGSSVVNNSEEIMLFTYSPSGTLITPRILSSSSSDISKNLFYDEQGYLYLTGASIGTGVLNFGNGFLLDPPPGDEAFLVKIDPNDSVTLATTLGVAGFVAGDVRIMGFAKGLENRMYIAGFHGPPSTGTVSTMFGTINVPGLGSSDILVASFMDTTALLPGPSLISGQVYADTNLNCLFEPGDIPQSGRLIRVDPGPYWAFTDQNGQYQVHVDGDSFSVKQSFNLIQSYTSAPICPGVNEAIMVNIPNSGDTIAQVNFANEEKDCYLLQVDVGSFSRRACFNNLTRINYHNAGNLDVPNAHIFLQLPPEISLVQADVPYQALGGNLYDFSVGTVPAGFYGSITITDYVSCSNPGTLIGQSRCTEVWATPISDCYTIDPSWSQAELAIIANCQNGIGIFNIRNQGSGNMLDSVEYRVYQDSSLVLQSRLQLNSGDSLSFQVLNTGSFLRVEVDQVPFHPYSAQINADLDGCILSATPSSPTILGGWSIAYEQFSNRLPHRSMDCMPITGAYDPNDKLAMPVGIGEDHIVPSETSISYRIRFQNTGNDTAFTVVLVDTLSGNLDPTSLIIGAASHSYSYTITGSVDPVLTVRFDNILLPDSNVNVLGSQGFFSFSMSPNDSLPQGETVENFADIYFDFNPPIRTNTTLHTFLDIVFSQVDSAQIELCDGTASAAIAGMDSSFCEIDSIQLSAIPPAHGIGFWEVDSGFAQIVDGHSPDTWIHSLNNGTNLFTWTVQLCDQLSIDSLYLIQEPAPNQPDITQNGNSSIQLCEGDSVIFSGPNGYNYLWSTGDTTQNLVISQSEIITLLLIGANQCSSQVSAPVSVVVDTLPDQPVILSNGSTTVCAGDSVILSGPSGYTYQWSTGDSSQFLTVDSAGSYSLVVWNTAGCQSPMSLPTSIQVNPLPPIPTVGVQGSLSFCHGDSVVLQGPTGYTYYWSSGDSTQSIIVSSMGAFSLTLFSPILACESMPSDTVYTTILPSPDIPVISVEDPILCDGDSLLLLSDPADSYIWNTGDSSQSLWVFNSGFYTVQVGNMFGCISDMSDTASIQVVLPPTQPSVIELGNDSLMASIAVDNYLWYLNGILLPDTTQIISATQSGTYSVIAQQASCESVESEPLLFTITSSDDIFAGGNVRIYPSPGKGLISIHATSVLARSVMIRVFDAKAASLLQVEVEVRDGILFESIDLSQYSDGTYIIMLDAGSYHLSKQIMIAR